MKELQLRSAQMAPMLESINKSLEVFVGYDVNFGMVEDDAFVCPDHVSEGLIDSSEKQTRNLSLQAVKTIEDIRTLLKRLTERELPNAQKSRCRLFILKRRAKALRGAEKKKRDATKAFKMERQRVAKDLASEIMPSQEEMAKRNRP